MDSIVWREGDCRVVCSCWDGEIFCVGLAARDFGDPTRLRAPTRISDADRHVQVELGRVPDLFGGDDWLRITVSTGGDHSGFLRLFRRNPRRRPSRCGLIWQAGCARTSFRVVALDDLIGYIYIASGVPDYRRGISSSFQHNSVPMLLRKLLQKREHLLSGLLKHLLGFGL
jgi:hypothetical protein